MSSIPQAHCRRCFCAVLAILFFTLPNRAEAQLAPDRYQSIPRDSLSLTSIDIAALRNRKELEMIPWEVISAFGKQELGIDPLLIATVDITAGMPSVNGPEFGASIKTTVPVDIAMLNDKLFTGISTSPKVKDMQFRNVHGAPMKVVQYDPQTLLFGTEATLRRMMSTKSKPSKIIELAGLSKNPYRTITAFEAVRPIVDGAFADVGGRVPPQLKDDIQVVIDELQYLVSGTDPFGSFGKIELKLVANDGESTKRLAAALERLRKNGMVFGEQAILAAIDGDKQISAEVKMAAREYLKRLKVFLSKAELWKVDGNEIAIQGEFAYTIPTIGILTGLLLPAVQAAREAARRVQSSNNLRQIGLSMHNYESAHRQLPVRVSKDANGKPLLSWRVALLPYMEQAALYQQFHLDEPWDSEHNIKLVERMPAVFSHPSFAGPRGHTVYLAPFYEGTVWSSDKPRFQDITDGLARTIAFFEVDDAHAVPWTKPDDLDLDNLDLLDCFRPMGSNAVIFDGSIRFLSKDIDELALEALVTSSGGER